MATNEELQKQADEKIKIANEWLPEQSVDVLKDAIEALDEISNSMTGGTAEDLFEFGSVTRASDKRISEQYKEKVKPLIVEDSLIYACDNKGFMLIYSFFTGGEFSIINLNNK